MATENLSAGAARLIAVPGAAAQPDAVDQLCRLQNELFSVHVLLLAIQSRLDQFEEEEGLDCSVCDSLGRLLTMAARDVHRLACGGAVEAEA